MIIMVMPLILISLGTAIFIQIILFIPAYLFKTDKLTDMSYGLTFILLALLILLQSTVTNDKMILFGMIFAWALRLVTYLLIRIRKIGKDSRFDGIREDFKKYPLLFDSYSKIIPLLYYFQSKIIPIL